MAHEYTFSDDFDYTYVKTVTVAGRLGADLVVCVTEAAQPGRSATALIRPGQEQLQSARPLETYEVELSERLVQGPCPATEFRHFPLERSDLLLPGGLIVRLPAGKQKRTPVLLGGLADNDFNKVNAARFDPTTRTIVLLNANQPVAQLEPLERQQVPKNFRSIYLFGDIEYYWANPLVDQPDSIRHTHASIERFARTDTVLIYFRASGGPLRRALYVGPGKEQLTTLIFGHFSKEEVGVRPWGLCLYPPALIGDILTGIVQVLFFYEDLKRGKCS